MEADCRMLFVNLIYRFFRFDIPSISLDILDISFPVSLPFSDKPGITIKKCVILATSHEKLVLTTTKINLLPVFILHHRNFSILKLLTFAQSKVILIRGSLDFLEAEYLFINIHHCVKSVRIRSNSGPYFSACGLNMRTRTTPNTGTFHAVQVSHFFLSG